MLSILSTASISPLLITYGYIILVPITIIEGPVATLIGGFLASLGYFNLVIVYIISFLGDIIGDLIYYAIGRWGTKRIISHGKFLWIKIEHAKKLEGHFEKHAGKTLLFGKWTHSVGGAILLAAGMSKMSLKKFIVFNSIGSFPKVLVFLILGYYFGSAYQLINKYFEFASMGILMAIALVVVAYLFVKKLRRKEHME